jgi:hypothetical protein
MPAWLIVLVSNLPAIVQEIVTLMNEVIAQGTPATPAQATKLTALMDMHNSIASATVAHVALPAAK